MRLRDELIVKQQEEIFELKLHRDSFESENKILQDHLTALQSSLKEKEEVNRGLQNACKKWENICEELKAENERLKETFLCPHCGQLTNHP
jgi:hypothetical protein